ncbi:hypothetical protein PUN28_007607 [Cardiocondyla obscurior]|uniref:Uncharacterized protein n=1 Tax=Cardiocondyla obscurior TaxID=286306 RepID=A0AAW2G6C0_9HYME
MRRVRLDAHHIASHTLAIVATINAKFVFRTRRQVPSYAIYLALRRKRGTATQSHRASARYRGSRAPGGKCPCVVLPSRRRSSGGGGLGEASCFGGATLRFIARLYLSISRTSSNYLSSGIVFRSSSSLNKICKCNL